MTTATAAWPVGYEEPGEIQNFYTATGATGGDYTLAIPAAEVWRVRVLRCVFTTAAVAGNRVVNVGFDAGLGYTNQYFGANRVNQPAGVGYRYTFYPSARAAAVTPNNGVVADMLDLLAIGGPTFRAVRIHVDNVQAGDVISGVGVTYERWLA